MAHKFDRSKADPYVEAAHEVERHVFSGREGYGAGAEEELYGALGDAIVTALGDIAAQAFRLGVNQPSQISGLARAVADTAQAVITSYEGEVDPEAALKAIQSDSRFDTLTPEVKERLVREIEKTRQLESLVLDARRIPDLIDFAGSLGLQIHEDELEQGTLLVSAGHTPTPDTS